MNISTISVVSQTTHSSNCIQRATCKVSLVVKKFFENVANFFISIKNNLSTLWSWLRGKKVTQSPPSTPSTPSDPQNTPPPPPPADPLQALKTQLLSLTLPAERSKFLNTSLLTACQNNNTLAITYLLKEGEGKFEQKTLSNSADSLMLGKNCDSLNDVLKQAVKFNKNSLLPKKMLMEACKNKDMTMINSLLEKQNFNRDALHEVAGHSVSAEHIPALQAILEKIPQDHEKSWMQTRIGTCAIKENKLSILSFVLNSSNNQDLMDDLLSSTLTYSNRDAYNLLKSDARYASTSVSRLSTVFHQYAADRPPGSLPLESQKIIGSIAADIMTHPNILKAKDKLTYFEQAGYEAALLIIRGCAEDVVTQQVINAPWLNGVNFDFRISILQELIKRKYTTSVEALSKKPTWFKPSDPASAAASTFPRLIVYLLQDATESNDEAIMKAVVTLIETIDEDVTKSPTFADQLLLLITYLTKDRITESKRKIHSILQQSKIMQSIPGDKLCEYVQQGRDSLPKDLISEIANEGPQSDACRRFLKFFMEAPSFDAKPIRTALNKAGDKVRTLIDSDTRGREFLDIARTFYNLAAWELPAKK